MVLNYSMTSLNREEIHTGPLRRLKLAPGGAVVKNLPANRRRGRLCFDPWVRKIPWGRKWQPTPVFLPEQFHVQRSLATVHGVTKSHTLSAHLVLTWQIHSTN